MSRVQPTPGIYRLAPAEKYHRAPYDVRVDGAGCREPGWGDPCPWSEAWQEFRRLALSGWQYGWVCFGSAYTHFAINPTPLPGASPIVILDTGSCERVGDLPPE